MLKKKKKKRLNFEKQNAKEGNEKSKEKYY